jgi:hypothetical protein
MLLRIILVVLRDGQMMQLRQQQGKRCGSYSDSDFATSVAEPEPQRDAAQAPNLMLNIGRLSKMSQTIKVSYFSHSILYYFQS